jgi:hypothetical protein
MPLWAKVSGTSIVRLTATVLVVQGWCPHCGRDLQRVQGGRLFGIVSGECAEHGPVDRALTA